MPVVTTETQTMCFYLRGADKAYLKLVVDSAGRASGELATMPAQKDSMRGVLNGGITVVNGIETFDGTYTNMAEGMNNIDQRLIRLTGTDAQIGYGEIVENPDGSYKYKDPSTVNYSFSIPRVDCAAYDATRAQS